MRRLNLFSYMLFFVFAICLQACGGDDDDNTGGGQPDTTTLSVTCEGDEISLITCPAEGCTTTLLVDTNGEWTVSVPTADGEWISMSPSEGNGRGYTQVKVASNSAEARTSTLTVRAGKLSKQITISQAAQSTADEEPIETVWEMMDNFTLGYNLGNTLDSNPSGDWWDPEGKTPTDYETSWGQPVVTQSTIDHIYEKGFKVIRVPVTWGPHMDNSYKVDDAWMNRVEEVVNYVLNHSEAYCIINVHHDTGTDGWLHADMNAYAGQSAKFKALWQQIATRFRDYDERLIFESLNEILNTANSWSAPNPGDRAYEAINKLQQDFVDVVRATGGNNEYRNLAVTTYAATTSQYAIDALELPSDVHPNHIYLSLHSYDPYNFCCDNGEWNVREFNSSCRTDIDNLFTRVSKRCASLGVPFVLGEFGAIDEGKSQAERVKYATYLGQKFKQYDAVGFWWMGLHDRTSNNWYDQAIVDALFNAWSN